MVIVGRKRENGRKNTGGLFGEGQFWRRRKRRGRQRREVTEAGEGQ
jgi:hypothetical protein